MPAHVAADAVVLLHFAFILFVVLGALLVQRWKWLVWLHVPAVVWAALIEFFGAVCPLTPLEQQLRIAAGEEGYSGGFIERYVVALIYPHGLTPSLQIAIGVFVIGINAAFYAMLVYRNVLRR